MLVPTNGNAQNRMALHFPSRESVEVKSQRNRSLSAVGDLSIPLPPTDHLADMENAFFFRARARASGRYTFSQCISFQQALCFCAFSHSYHRKTPQRRYRTYITLL